MNVDHTRKLTHISLCTGYGGIDLGLSRALGDVRTVAYVEIEAFAVENLVAKIEGALLDVAPIWSDLKTFPWELYHKRVDILSGGFPCQPFSAAGRRSGDDDPRHLWPYITDGIKRLGRPPLVFFENVEGIISSKLKSDDWSDPKGTPVLLHVLRELERLGYDATAGIYSAREVGAPHQRKRVFIMGCRSDLSESGRAFVSGLLVRGRGTESGVNLVDPCDNSGRRSRASLHGERRTVAGRRARVSSERRTSNAHPQYASISADVGNSESRNRTSPLRGREPELGGIQIPLRESGTAYPAPRGAEQYTWEPPRVTREAQPPMGRDIDGAPYRLDYAELSRSLDNRTDELRLLGNGVVPDTAERAFRELWRDLNT